MLAAAAARVYPARPPPWSAVAAVTTILLPAATVGAVLAVSRKTSSLIGLSGVNAMCSVPCAVVRSGLNVKTKDTFGRCGSGAA